LRAAAIPRSQGTSKRDVDAAAVRLPSAAKAWQNGTMERVLTMLAGVSGFLAVGVGAFGAHALKDKLTPDLMAIYQTGVQYHLVHAVALFGAALLAGRSPASSAAVWAGWAFVAGTVIFSGSLYALALTGVRSLGAVTPLGGVAFLAGWLCVAWAAWGTP
jgi:uncharacterized membrane protein YgdD (TMEM256/DUF423 family)